MAKLDEAAREALQTAIDNCKKNWILAAYERERGMSLPVSLEGTLGFFDWRLHGQISRLVKRNLIKTGELTMISSGRHLGKASLLVFGHKEKAEDSTEVVEALKKLKISEVCIAEKTWPATAQTKLKKQLTKAGIAWEYLETQHDS